MTKVSANTVLADFVRAYGPPVSGGPIDNAALHEEGVRAGRSIYRKTMKGKLKLTDNA